MTNPYDPGTPQPSDIPADSQDDFVSNFHTINSQYSVDHYPFAGSVDNATSTNPIIITSPNHHLVNGNSVTFSKCQDLTGASWPLNSQTAVVTVLNANQFSVPINGTTYPTYKPFTGEFQNTDSTSLGLHVRTFLANVLAKGPLDGATSANQSAYYSKENYKRYGKDKLYLPNLFFQNVVGNTQPETCLTNIETTAENDNGRAYALPWGMTIQFGGVTINPGPLQTFKLPVAFTTGFLTMILTPNNSSTRSTRATVSTPTVGPFDNFKATTGLTCPSNYYWMALGV